MYGLFVERESGRNESGLQIMAEISPFYKKGTHNRLGDPQSIVCTFFKVLLILVLFCWEFSRTLPAIAQFIYDR